MFCNVFCSYDSSKSFNSGAFEISVSIGPATVSVNRTIISKRARVTAGNRILKPPSRKTRALIYILAAVITFSAVAAAVTFSPHYGLPTGENFSVIQITDTQYLSEWDPALFDKLTSWIVNESAPLNVSMVIHTGDIVNVHDSPLEWRNANTAMLKLYDAGVPYCWDAGNHDQINPNSTLAQNIGLGDPNGTWSGGEYPAFNVTNFESKLYWVSSIFNGTSTAVKFSYGDYRFMAVNIEYNSNQTVLGWAANLIESNPTVNVIVATHDFLNGYGTYGYTFYPQDILWASNFEKWLNGFPNVFMTLNGHDIMDGGTAFNHKVGNREEIFFNRQESDNEEGAGTARIYAFYMGASGRLTVKVSTFQDYGGRVVNGTSGGVFLTDPKDNFSFTAKLIKSNSTG